MRTIIIIPARFQSVRFPGKPLVQLTSKVGVKKSLINLTWEAAKTVQGVDDVFVATDDQRISDAVNKFGGKVIMTDNWCKNGTERCAMAIRQITSEPDLIINFQGDAPLTPSWFIESLIESMINDEDAEVATPILRFDNETYQNFRADRKKGLIGGTTVTFNNKKYALYFSKEMIPYFENDQLTMPSLIPMFHHVGVYAYRPKVLEEYISWPEGFLESLEGLEQLRFLENNRVVKCIEVDSKGQLFWELNNPEDIERVEAALG